MINIIRLEHLVELMASSNYRDRFVAEYIQLKQRYEKLKAFNTAIEAAIRTRCAEGPEKSVDMPVHDCPVGLLREQQTAMREYLHILELRAVIEGIDLQEAIRRLVDKALCGEALCCQEIQAEPDPSAEPIPSPIGEGRGVEDVAPYNEGEELVEERRLELIVCGDCIHFPICNYLVGRIEKFKLPREKQSCDLFESINGYGEERLKDESDVTLK